MSLEFADSKKENVNLHVILPVIHRTYLGYFLPSLRRKVID